MFTDISSSDVHVLTAPEIWFMLDRSGIEIGDPKWELLRQNLSTHSRVKFILAKQEGDSVHLGIFYPCQVASTCAHALHEFLVWGQQPLTRETMSDNLAQRIEEQYRIEQTWLPGATLLWGGRIHADPSQDKASSTTLEIGFGLWKMSETHMKVVRELVFKKLGI